MQGWSPRVNAEQIVKVRSGTARLHRTQKGCALLGRLTKTLYVQVEKRYLDCMHYIDRGM